MLTSKAVSIDPASELSALYAVLAKRLEQIVRLDVRAPDAVIEDACQFAWWKLLCHVTDVHREAALSWLITTAVREACRLVRRRQCECSLDELLEVLPEQVEGAATIDSHELAVARERLATIGQIPSREQRMLWLQGLGLSYREMAAHECCTTRTVERQLLRAKHRLRRTPTE